VLSGPIDLVAVVFRVLVPARVGVAYPDAFPLRPPALRGRQRPRIDNAHQPEVPLRVDWCRRRAVPCAGEPQAVAPLELHAGKSAGASDQRRQLEARRKSIGARDREIGTEQAINLALAIQRFHTQPVSRAATA
jgi:hypothetical protein